RKETFTPEGLDEALYHGAVLRVRPKAMTVAVIIAGLLPILDDIITIGATLFARISWPSERISSLFFSPGNSRAVAVRTRSNESSPVPGKILKEY
ncbi:hypothetical protein, partial [Klebsiella pneumoniae]|uniref:hypothetical protein n=1 Tax=Klebsiella pneumoniae TaxID=573 RepID=UPI001C8F9BC7